MMKTSKTVVITGASRGLGLACAQVFGRYPEWQIVLAVRDMQRGEHAAHMIRAKVPTAMLSVLPMDLASLTSIRAFPEQLVKAALPPLHAIICNAAVQTFLQNRRTTDGFELTFGTNHLGHFLLTHVLFPALVGPARIVVVASGVHDNRVFTGLPKPRLRPAAELANESNDPYESPRIVGGRAYTTSKLCNILFVHELDRRLRAAGRDDITVNAFDPGGMLSGLVRDWPWWGQVALTSLWPVLRLLPNISTAQNAGQALADLVTGPHYQGISGRYYSIIGRYQPGAEEKASSPNSYNEQIARELWIDSAALVGCSPHEI